MNKRNLLRHLGAALIASPLLVGAAFAQDYPSKPIRIVAPFAPGGAVDILARIVAERLQPAYGQTVIVDNKPGASGHVGAQIVARSPGDGYTLMVGTIGIHAAYASYSKLTYEPAKELQPIMILGEAPNIVLVPENSKYKTFADFLADAKANPGKINYASAGPGSSVHMVTELFQLAIGQRMNHVPYKGSGPALTDLIGGQVDVMFDNLSSGSPHVRSGKLRALAVTGPQRDPRFPDVPTVAESGVPGYSGTSWFTLAAPASMPAPLVARLNRDVEKLLASPEVVERFNTLGMGHKPNTPAEANAFFKSETEKWTRVIQAANLKLD
ncbi:MAG: tripartite tricarboxylate transporter substrate binding protein [Hydrogenophaga sp.]|uniref:Bug family tripartite tricarboxylate transporter substrate binding protein n=1 Tax=Hydrogenophaga sp. TaxID=1904254 RepID=UPI001D73955C|nr:tripartite tricarboxylate transporter substrate binding protein [Hydrogenophaga sp.]MBX3608846.1 tripartite tricarboxylate transporter substrate binding protein [Hydrogenophaga sp.]